MTFDEIEALYGEESAINAGIVRDPDSSEWTAEDFARARPAIEVVPHLVEHSLVLKTAHEYFDRGYAISTDALLDFIPGFLADLVVRKDGESKVIEVKSWSSLVADSRIAKLADVIDSKPSWTFELIFPGEWDDRNASANTPVRRMTKSSNKSNRPRIHYIPASSRMPLLSPSPPAPPRPRLS